MLTRRQFIHMKPSPPAKFFIENFTEIISAEERKFSMDSTPISQEFTLEFIQQYNSNLLKETT